MLRCSAQNNKVVLVAFGQLLLSRLHHMLGAQTPLCFATLVEVTGTRHFRIVTLLKYPFSEPLLSHTLLLTLDAFLSLPLPISSFFFCWTATPVVMEEESSLFCYCSKLNGSRPLTMCFLLFLLLLVILILVMLLLVVVILVLLVVTRHNFVSRKASHWWSMVVGRFRWQLGHGTILQGEMAALVFWICPLSRHLSIRNE